MTTISEYLRVMWVVVPTGVVGSKLQFTVLAQPKLISSLPSNPAMAGAVRQDVRQRVAKLFGPDAGWTSRIAGWQTNRPTLKFFKIDNVVAGKTIPNPIGNLTPSMRPPVGNDSIWRSIVGSDPLLPANWSAEPLNPQVPTRSYPGASIAQGARALSLLSQVHHFVGRDAIEQLPSALIGIAGQDAVWPQNRLAGLRWGPGDRFSADIMATSRRRKRLTLPDENSVRVAHRNLHRFSRSPATTLSDRARDLVKEAADGSYRMPTQAAAPYQPPILDHVLDFMQFHGRARPAASVKDRLSTFNSGTSQPEARPEDVFSKIAMMQNYPNFLPYVALAFTVEIDAAALAGLFGAADPIQGAVGFAPPPDPDLSDIVTANITGFEYSSSKKTLFALDRKDRNDDIKNEYKVDWIDHGEVDFASGPAANPSRDPENKFYFETFDFDGAAFKLTNFAHMAYQNVGVQIVYPLWPFDPHPGGASPKAFTVSKDTVLFASSENKATEYGLPAPSSPVALELVQSYAKMLITVRRMATERAKDLFELTNSGQENIDFRRLPVLTNYPLSRLMRLPVSNNGPALCRISVNVLPGRFKHYLALHFEPNDEPDQSQYENLPSFRSTGISLLANDRGEELEDAKFNSSRLAALEPTADWTKPILLDSADLFLGYVPFLRVSPPSGTDRWVPLTLRDERYGPDSGDWSVELKGKLAALRLAVGRSTDSHDDGPPPKDDHAPPRLFRWSGEPLGVPPNVSAAMDDRDKEIASSLPPASFLPVSLTVPDHSVPRLRFTTSDRVTGLPIPYQFHIAVMDRAGNFPTPKPPTDPLISRYPLANECVYLRYQPIPAPIVLLENSFRASESPQKSPTTMVVEHDEPDRRWLAPPRADVDLCRQHGMFDVQDFWAIGSFEDVKLDERGYFQSVQVREGAGEDGTNASRYIPRSIGCNGDRPYYPDPMARRMAYRVEEVHAGRIPKIIEIDSLDFHGRDWQWPRARALSIVALPAPRRQNRISVSTTNSELRIYLPRGTHARVTLTSAPDSDASSNFGPKVMALNYDVKKFDDDMAVYLTGESAFSASTRVESGILNGNNPLVTPPLTLELFHPVERPLTDEARPEPALEHPRLIQDPSLAPRDHNNPGPLKPNDAFLSTRVDIDVRSTGKVDFILEWIDPIDDPSLGPAYIERKQNLIIEEHDELDGNYPAPIDYTGMNARFHSFPDARHRIVQYRARAHTAFRSFYDANKPTDDFVRLSGPAVKKIKADELPPENPDQLCFLNSKLPDPPSVSYGVPTFRWSTETAGKTYTSLRKSRSIALWLNRGWFSSGRCEKLGIFCLKDPEFFERPGTDQKLRRFFTRWGSDPGLNKTPMPTFGPSAANFEGGEMFVHVDRFPGDDKGADGKPIFVENIPGEIAVFTPLYNEERRLWYCNIELNSLPVSYPFIKLMLMRYQAHSQTNCYYSYLVPADFAQLYPDRSASVTRRDRRTLEVRIYGQDDSDRVHGDIAVDVYRQCDDARPDLGWEPVTNRNGEVTTTEIEMLGPTELRAFSLRFPTHLIGKRMIRVVETDSIRPRTVYADVLELSFASFF